MIENITGKDFRHTPNVFLDLDGTITQSGEGCVNGVRYMFEQIGYIEDSEERINDFVGPTIKVHLQQAYGFSPDEIERAYAHYREYYDNHGIHQSRLYPGIREAIEQLLASGKTVYVATLKPHDQAAQILSNFGLLDLFAGVYGARHDIGILHKPEVLAGAVSQNGLDPASCVIAGDRNHDVLAGRHVGMGTVGVRYGYGSRQELLSAGVDIIADTIEELIMILGGDTE